MKENETHCYALVKEAFLGTKGYVGWVLCLLVHSPIHLQWLHDAIKPELVTKSACNEWSKRKMVFEEKVKYWCDCGCCDSWAVVIVGLLWNCWYWYRLKIISLSHLIGVLFLHFVLIEVHEQWKNPSFFYSCYIFFSLKMCFSNSKRRGGLRKANRTNLRWAKCKVLNHG